MVKRGRPLSFYCDDDYLLKLDCDYSRSQIADFFGVSLSTVNRRIKRIREEGTCSLITEERSDDNETKSS